MDGGANCLRALALEAILGQADWHNRDRLHDRVQCGELLDALMQRSAIVDARQRDDLGMYVDSQLAKAANLVEHIGYIGLAEHNCA
jgi:hypothetical protein